MIPYKRADINYLNHRHSFDSGVDYLLRKGYTLDKIEETANRRVIYVSEYFALRDNKGNTLSYIALDTKYLQGKLIEFAFVELK